MPCDDRCDLPSGSVAVAVGKGEHVSGIDFALDRGARLAGTITDAVTGQPVAGANVFVESAIDGIHYRSFGTTDAAGHYMTHDPIGTGSDHVFVDRRDVYLGSAWPGVPCFADCARIGTPMSVVAGDTLSGIDFALVRGGSISGTARDARTKQPIPGITVQLLDVAGISRDSTVTDEQGRYALRGLAGGFYFLVAQDRDNYVYASEVLGGQHCPPFECDPTGGRSVRVTGERETAQMDFLLDAGGSVSGTVRSADTGEPIMWASIWVYDRKSLALLATAYTGADGTYRTREPLAATKVIVLVTSGDHEDELYDNVPCETSCNAKNGTPVTVRSGETTQGINFDLASSREAAVRSQSGGRNHPILPPDPRR